MTGYSIGEVARQTGLSIDTLRYYERIDLLTDIGRNQSGHRCYSEDDLGWLNLLMCLRDTGMPIADMIRFAALIRLGEATVSERIDLLSDHKQNVLNKIDQMQRKLEGVEAKLNHYLQQEQEG